MKLIVLVTFLVSVNFSFAEPPRYMKACEGKKLNDPCTFTSKKSGTVVTDTCRDGKTPKGRAVLTCGVINPPLSKRVKALFK